MIKLQPILVGLLVLALHATPVLAKIPPKPGPPPQANPVMGWVIAVVCLAAVGVAAFKSAKRTHQD